MGEFNFYRSREYKLHPCWTAKLERAMPSMAKMEWHFTSLDNSRMSSHGQPRPGLTAGTWDINPTLLELDLSGNLQSLTVGLVSNICLWSDKQRDCYAEDCCFVRINSSLHKISKNLRHLRITGGHFLTPDLFWPALGRFRIRGDEHWLWGKDNAARIREQLGTAYWPRLETLIFDLEGPQQFFSPNFMTYFDEEGYESEEGQEDSGMEDDGDEEDHYARHEKEFKELVIAMSRGMLHMPKLRELSVITPEWRSQYPRKCGFQYKRECITGSVRRGDPVYDTYFPLRHFAAKNAEWKAPGVLLRNWRKLIDQVQSNDWPKPTEAPHSNEVEVDDADMDMD